MRWAPDLDGLATGLLLAALAMPLACGRDDAREGTAAPLSASPAAADAASASVAAKTSSPQAPSASPVPAPTLAAPDIPGAPPLPTTAPTVARATERDCPASGVLHGPWSTRLEASGVEVRWDACRAGNAAILVTPESGGPSRRFEGTQTAAEVRTAHDPGKGLPPDRPGNRHLTKITILGLSAGSCHRYALEAEPSRGGRFCTARKPGERFVFAAIGDTNPAKGDTAGVLRHAFDGRAFGVRPDFTLHLGDMQYYDQVVESYATWFPAMKPLFAAGALQPALGNHELELPHELEDYYARLFGEAGRDGTTEYYRFDSGGVWFFSLDTELDLTPGSPQGRWVEAQLADAAARPGHRASVVYFHKPWITLADYPQYPELRRHYLASFRKHGVKLVLMGHIHGYERFEEDGVTYVVSGGGGAAFHDLDAAAAKRPVEATHRKASARRYHATLIEVGPRGLEGRVIANDGARLDAFAIPVR